jgi:hypothetical protein
MNIITRYDDQDCGFQSKLETIDEWKFANILNDVPGQQARLKNDFWLGSSRDGSVWALAATPYAGGAKRDDESALNGQTFWGGIPVLLHDPPKRNESSIMEILARIWNLYQNGGRPDARELEKVAGSVEFPTYKPVAHYLPEAPEEWLKLPSVLAVGFTLSDCTSIGTDTFDEFERDSMEDAFKVLCGEREWGLLIGYTIAAREVIPFLPWLLDAPLSRRGSSEPEEREKVQGELPWELVPDQKLVSVYQTARIVGSFWSAPSPYAETSIRLQVGGLSPENAIENWERCAKALRRMKKKVVGKKRGRRRKRSA